MATWEGGMAFYGAVFAVAATILVVTRMRRISFWTVADVGCIFAVVGQAFGRIGNIINGDVVGPPTDLPWGFIYAHPGSFVADHTVAYHPAAVYELLFNVALFALLWSIRWKLPRPGSPLRPLPVWLLPRASSTLLPPQRAAGGPRVEAGPAHGPGGHVCGCGPGGLADAAGRGIFLGGFAFEDWGAEGACQASAEAQEKVGAQAQSEELEGARCSGALRNFGAPRRFMGASLPIASPASRSSRGGPRTGTPRRSASSETGRSGNRRS